MSQEKVDRYKEQKANRQKIMKKEKREKLMLKIGGYAVVLLLVAWVGFSAFDRFYEAPIRYYDADLTALTDYIGTLGAEEETDAEDESDAEDATEETAAENETEEAAEETETVSEEDTEAVTDKEE